MNNLDFTFECKLVQHLLHLAHLHISTNHIDGVEGVFEQAFRDRLHYALQSLGVRLPIVCWLGSNKTEAEVGSSVGWAREIKICVWINSTSVEYNSLGVGTGLDCLFEVWLRKLKTSDEYFFGGNWRSLIEKLIKYMKVVVKIAKRMRVIAFQSLNFVFINSNKNHLTFV